MMNYGWKFVALVFVFAVAGMAVTPPGMYQLGIRTGELFGRIEAEHTKHAWCRGIVLNQRTRLNWDHKGAGL